MARIDGLIYQLSIFKGMMKTYIKPNIKKVLFQSDKLMSDSKNVRGYAIDNEDADDDKIIKVEKQNDYFFIELF